MDKFTGNLDTTSNNQESESKEESVTKENVNLEESENNQESNSSREPIAKEIVKLDEHDFDKLSISDDFESSHSAEVSINQLLNILPLDEDASNHKQNGTDSSISEDIKEVSESEHVSSEMEQDRSLNSLDLTDLAISQFRENDMASPTKLSLNLSRELKPDELTFELELNPEIKFNISENNTSPEKLLQSRSISQILSHNRCSLSLDYTNENKVQLIKKAVSLEEDPACTILPDLDLHGISNTDTTNEEHTSEPKLEAKINKYESNTTHCQYRDIDSQNIDMFSGRDGNITQSLLDSIDTGTTSTEYKVMCEEFSNKMSDYQNAILERDQVIETLTQSLQESRQQSKDLKTQMTDLHEEIHALKEKVTRDSPPTESVEHEEEDDVIKVLRSAHITSVLVNSDLQKFAKTLPPMQRLEFDDIKYKLEILVKHEKEELKQRYEDQIRVINDTLKNEKQDLENEISRLRQALCEFKDSGTDILQIKKHLQEQHKQEVEDLRTYFEKKCADMEKHYSEEVFSQQSRRVSAGSLTDSDLGDLFYNPNTISPIKHQHAGDGDANQIPNISKKEDHSLQLEVLQNKFDKKLSEITAEYDMKLKTIEQKYQNELTELKLKINNDQNNENLNEVLQEVLLQSENQLQEQVELVRQDVLNTLEEQIKILLSDNSVDSSEWPSELVQLKDKFTADSQQEIMRLKHSHENEISKLRNDYENQLNRKMQRNTSFDKNRDLSEVIRERNGLRKVNQTLRSLITELIGYVSECETELNNTLWGNLDQVVQLCDNTGIDDSVLQNVSNLDTTDVDPNTSCVSRVSKHVHFAPDVSQFLEQLHSDSIWQNLETDKSVAVELKTELSNCLDRLKSEASAILKLTNLTKTGADNVPDNQKIGDLLMHVSELEKEKHDLLTELIELQKERDDLKIQLVNAATQKHEIVSEGYGDHSPVRNPLVKQSTFSELRQRANTLLSSNVVNTPLLQLFEDLCREGDRIYDEANQDRDDLQLQIEAADKQLRSTRQFLEEQAAEREQERDDFTKEIIKLQEKLKERDKERLGHETVLKEVELLENQMREMSTDISANDQRKQELEMELKTSVDKICLLSDIIRELENQLEAKSLNEKYQEKKIVDLQNVNEEQHKSYEILTRELLTVQHESDVKMLNDKITGLEEQLHSHRQSTENAEAVLQIKKQIEDIGTCIDLKTKLLESLHAAVYSTSCSSEDVSLKDRKVEPEPSKSSDSKSDSNSPVAALEHLQQIQEKLHRHSKAEEAALKRIRDLEMQIATLKHNCTEIRNEKDILQERSQQQIIELSSLQSRLDDQRRRADSIHKQSTSDLHLQIHNLQSELSSTKEQLVNKNRRIQNLEQIIEESRMRLVENQTNVYDKNSPETISKLKELNELIATLQKENKDLRHKVKLDKINKVSLPDLMDTMLDEKNEEIETLKEKLDQTCKELQKFLDLRLTEDEMNVLLMSKEKKDIQEGSKLSARTLSDIGSISDYDEPDVMRRHETKLDSLHFLGNSTKPDLMGSPPFSFTGFNLTNQDDIQFRSLPFSKDLTDNKEDDLNDIKPDFFQIDNSPKLPHKLDLIPENEERSASEASSAKIRIGAEEDLRMELKGKNEKLIAYEKQLSCVPILEKEMDNLRLNLQDTLKTMEEDKKRFETMISFESELKEQNQCIQNELAEKQNEILSLEKCLQEKDDLLNNLKKEHEETITNLDEFNGTHNELINENAQLKLKLNDLSTVEMQLKTELSTKKDIIQQLEAELATKKDVIERLERELSTKKDIIQQLEVELSSKKDVIEHLETELPTKKDVLEQVENELSTKKDVIERLETMLLEKNQELITMRDYTDLLKQTIKEKTDSLVTMNKQVQDQLIKIDEHRDTIEKLTRDLTDLKLQQNNEIEHFNHEIRERDHEILHVKELLQEKEKIINHMSTDSDNLHTALATIQNKLKESGNVLDLAMKLKDELRKNELLSAEVEQLRNMLSRMELNASPEQIDDIAKQVQKELDVSVKLDSSIIQAIESDDFLSDDNEKLSSENEVLQLKLDQEMKRNVKLLASKETLLIDMKKTEEKLKEEEACNKDLRQQLQNEVDRCNEMQLQDADIMEALRLRLEKALDKESSLQNLLEDERNNRKLLERQLSDKFKRRDDFEPLDDDFIHDELMPEAKRLRKDLEIQMEINDRLTSEILLLRTQLDLEKGKLVDEVRSLERQRQEYQIKMEKNLERIQEQKNGLTRELYEANHRSIQQCERIASLESRIKNIQSSEIRRTHRKDKDKQDQLATMLKQQELQTQTSSLEAKLVSLQNELELAIQRESALRDALNEKKDINTDNVSAQFLNKLKEMSTILEQHVSDKKHSNVLGSHKLENLDHISIETYNNALDKANHLFGKYLRSESYRKALTWQKSYLLLVQRGYETAEKQALNNLQMVPKTPDISPKQRFRVSVLAVMAISRMQFLVRRWQLGKIIGGRIATNNSNHKKRRPSTNYNVWSIPQSPPCRDRDRPNCYIRDKNLDNFTKYDSQERISALSPDVHKYL